MSEQYRDGHVPGQLPQRPSGLLQVPGKAAEVSPRPRAPHSERPTHSSNTRLLSTYHVSGCVGGTGKCSRDQNGQGLLFLGKLHSRGRVQQQMNE